MKQSMQINCRNCLSIAIVVVTVLFSSCKKKELPIDDKEGNAAAPAALKPGGGGNDGDIPYISGSPTVLGTPKQNPYLVANMTTAWADLARRGILSNTESGVYTTHYYVKFKPTNSNQYEALHQDTTLALSDFPIESTVVQNGDYYHDPSLPDSVPTYQYTAVKVGYQFPDSIPYEIIGNLYLPEQDTYLQYENGGGHDFFVETLLNQAFIQTANYEDTIDVQSPSVIAGRRYTPGGNIQVFDTRLQSNIGMEGIRVQARRWFIIYNGYPDLNGDYRMSHSFTRPCNYSAWFAASTFAVRHNLVNTTFWINGPKLSGDWNYTLNNSYQRFAGHVFRGAYRYHFKNIARLARPWLPTGRQLYIAVDAPKSWSGINWIIFPVIRVARFHSNGVEYQSDEVFSTACHETAHTSHMLHMNGGVIQFIQVTEQLRESWAIAIEHYITNIEYDRRGIIGYGNEFYFPTVNPPQYPNSNAYQYWNSSIFSGAYDYTNLYINITDNYNEIGLPFPGGQPNGTVNDQVTGYTLPDIEATFLKHCYGKSSLTTELKNNKPAGVTDAQIDLLISYY